MYVPRARLIANTHKRKYLPYFISSSWIKATRKALEIKDFWKAFQWRVSTKRNNHVFVSGSTGEGKTNALLYFVQKANELFNHKIVLKPYMTSKRKRQHTTFYIGRAISLAPALMGTMHGLLAGKPNETIGVDETELCVPRGALSNQVRDALQFCDTIRENQTNGFYAAPTSRAVHSLFVDERMNWRIHADFIDQEKKKVECVVEINAIKRADEGAEWLHYQDLTIDFVDKKIFNKFRDIKNKAVYTSEGIIFDYNETLKQAKREAKLDLQEEYIKQFEEIVESDLSRDTQIMEALRITKRFVGPEGIPKSILRKTFSMSWDKMAEYEIELVKSRNGGKER